MCVERRCTNFKGLRASHLALIFGNSTMALREEMIARAVQFLLHPKVVDAPLSKKVNAHCKTPTAMLCLQCTGEAWLIACV
jgi:Pex14 N-terminal domain